MLVLSRKLGERITVGEGPESVTITVVQIDRGKIRLGIEAPSAIPITRPDARKLIPAGEGSPR